MSSPFLRIIVPIASVVVPVVAITLASYAKDVPTIDIVPKECVTIAPQLVEAVEAGVLAKLQAIAIYEHCVEQHSTKAK